MEVSQNLMLVIWQGGVQSCGLCENSAITYHGCCLRKKWAAEFPYKLEKKIDI